MQKRLKQALEQGGNFIVNAEITAGLRFNFAPIEGFMKGFIEQGRSVIPKGFDFIAVSATQNPSGMANIEPVDVLERLRKKNLLGDLDFIPHVTGKDHNTDAVSSILNSYRDAGVECTLMLTGDKPSKAKGVFELESVGLLSLVRYLNNDLLIRARPEALADVHQFYPGAAVSPFKYTEPSQMQQYYKMEKKIASGAKFLVTQLGWDWRKSLELFQYVRDDNINVPILGYVYLLCDDIALKKMHKVDLTGCFVSDALYDKVRSESRADHIARAAQQVAMYKSMGAAGVDIGGVFDYETFVEILKQAAEIGDDWEKYKDNLYFPLEGGWYLYDEAGRQVALSKLRMKLNHRMFNTMHRAILNSDYKGFHCFKKLMSLLGTEKGKGFFYKLFFMQEKVSKYLLFECNECGDCFLPENFSICTIGDCEKGLNNAPCGDATADGKCGNNLEIECVGEKIYNAAAAERGGLAKLRSIINPPRNSALENTSSILNYLFGKDHTMKPSFVSIGEAVHASIPKTGKIMKELADLGPDAYTKDSPQLQYIIALIQSQVADGADYLEVNLDAFGETNPQVSIDMMKEYVRLVRKYSDGVPICVDSSNDDVLIAGLKEWYDTEEPVKQPLLNSVKVYTMDNIFPLKKEYDFAFIGLLIGEDKPTGPGGSHSVEELFSFAQQLFDEATEKYGFKPEEIYFDSTVFPLAIDMPMQPGVPGYTYRAFETIRKIKTDPKMKNVHFSLGISNCARDLPARKIGIMRAYTHTAMKYGCDAGIVNVKHQLYGREHAPELMELIEAYAQMDGSQDKCTKAMMLMGDYCKSSKK